MSTLKAEGLLTDDGYRPLAATDSEPSSNAGSAEDRQALAAQAAYEIESIALTLQSLDDTTDNAFLMRGLFLRIEALNSIIISVTSGGDEGRELGEMREVIYGSRHLEANHG